MFDAAGSFERDLGDSLHGYERDVLRLWDAGGSLAAIAASVGMARDRVERVVGLYDDRPDPDARAGLADANARHVAAIVALRGRCQGQLGRLRERGMTRPPQREGGYAAPAQTLVEVSDIVAMLTDKIDVLARELLPNVRQEGHELCVGSIAGEPGQSLRINIGSGPKRGWWRDFSSSEGGDALCLIEQVLFAGNRKSAVQWAKSWLRLDDDDPARIEQHRLEATAARERRLAEAAAARDKAIRSAVRRWQQAQALAAGDPVCRYLAARGIDLAQLGRAPGALRYHPALQYGFPDEGAAPIKVPAMVAMVTNLAGQHIATHRIWLDVARDTKAGPDLIGHAQDGKAADPKKVMGSPLGGHISLWKGTHRCPLRDVPPGTDVYVSEGIEDGLTAAAADPSLRVICMVALGYLADLELPAQMGRLVILRQNDPAGSKAEALLMRAVAAHRAAGRRVFFVDPPKGVKDLNDLALEAAP